MRLIRVDSIYYFYVYMYADILGKGIQCNFWGEGVASKTKIDKVRRVLGLVRGELDAGRPPPLI